MKLKVSERLVSLNTPSFLSVTMLLLIRKEKCSLWLTLMFSLHRSCPFFHLIKTAILFNRIQSVCMVNYFVNKGNVYIVNIAVYFWIQRENSLIDAASDQADQNQDKAP